MTDLPIVASWGSLKIGTIHIVHRGPQGEEIEQPCRIVARTTKDAFLSQWPHPVRVAGRFFYHVETD